MIVDPASVAPMVRAALVISNPANLDADETICRGRALKVGRWSHHLGGDKRLPMTEFLLYALVPIAIGAVAVVLLFGLSNMARGGSPHRSQKLMRLRVLLQFIAIIVIMLTIWAIGK
jgi:hypothetical protein